MAVFVFCAALVRGRCGAVQWTAVARGSFFFLFFYYTSLCFVGALLHFVSPCMEYLSILLSLNLLVVFVVMGFSSSVVRDEQDSLERRFKPQRHVHGEIEETNVERECQR